MSTAGKPAIIEFFLIFLVTPLFEAIVTLSSIIKCPAIPTCPPIRQFFPIFVLPAIPVCAAIIEFFPT